MKSFFFILAAYVAIAMYFPQGPKTYASSHTPGPIVPSTRPKLSSHERIMETIHGPHSASQYYADSSPDGLRATSGIPSWVSSEVAETPEELASYHQKLSHYYWNGIVVEAQSNDRSTFSNDVDGVYDTWWRRRVGMNRVVLEEINNTSPLDLNKRKNNIYKGLKRYMIALQDLKMLDFQTQT